MKYVAWADLTESVEKCGSMVEVIPTVLNDRDLDFLALDKQGLRDLTSDERCAAETIAEAYVQVNGVPESWLDAETVGFEEWARITAPAHNATPPDSGSPWRRR